MLKTALFFSFFIFLLPLQKSCVNVPNNNGLSLISIEKIWNNKKHNGFTSFTDFKNVFYVAFRESERHNHRNGILNLIKSLDGKNWERVSTVSIPGKDLRDPKLVVNQYNQLILYGMSRDGDEKGREPHYTHSWVLQNDSLVANSTDVTDVNTWKWGVNKVGDNIMSIAYSGKDKKGTLYSSPNGFNNWSVIAKNIYPDLEDFPNECSLIQLKDGSMLALLRKNKGNKKAMIGTSVFPYKKWKWSELDKQIGGPSLIQLSNGEVYACVRLYDKVRTVLCKLDLKTKTLEEIYTLPSGHDTSYAGMVERNDTLYLSYYSNHETNWKIADIFFVKFKIND